MLPTSPRKIDERLAVALAALTILVVGIVAYSGSFRGVLLLDDHPTIEQNPSIRRLSWEVWSPPPNVGTAGRPLANLTFAINRALNGHDLWGYHALNLSVHLTTALLIFGLGRRLLALGESDRRVRNATRLAMFGPLFWVAHPLTTESVTYLSQRTEALAACGYAATLYAALRYATGRRTGWAILACCVCALAMACKETAVTAPLVALGIDAVFVAGSWRRVWKERRGFYLALGLCWVLLAMELAAARLGTRGVGFHEGVGAAAYPLVECRALLLYLRLSLWPHPLVFDYGWAQPMSAFGSAAAAIVVLGGAAWCSWAAWRGRRTAWLGLMWLLVLAPTSSLVPIADQPFAENRPYLALAIVAVGLVVVAHRVIGRAFWLAAPAVVMALAATTGQRNTVYRSEPGIWLDVLRARPENPRALNELGLLALRAGDVSRAIAWHERAVALRPAYGEAEGNLGADLMRAHRAKEAVAHFQRALAANPSLPGGHGNLGMALLQAGDIENAVDELELAVQHDASRPAWHLALGQALARAGQGARGMAEFHAALQLEPHNVEARIAVANALLLQRDWQGAAAEYETALQDDPGQAFAHNNLAFASLRLGKPEEALAQAKEALRLRPNYAAAHANAANAWLALNRPAEASEQFRAGLALEPRSAAMHTGLGVALIGRGAKDQAADEFKVALQIDPNYAPAAKLLEQLAATPGR